MQPLQLPILRSVEIAATVNLTHLYHSYEIFVRATTWEYFFLNVTEYPLVKYNEL